MHEEFASRFWERVDKASSATGCWLWTGSRLPRGYGRFYFKNRGYYAHRIAWEMANDRPISDGLVILHKCDNPQCCNPEHLTPDTQRENMIDMRSKGRAGDPSHKLTADDVKAIRARKGLATQREIASQFGVDRALISLIHSGKIWRDVA